MAAPSSTPAAPRAASAWPSDARITRAGRIRGCPEPVRIVQRLKTKAQFQAVMAAGTVARTAHFALHRMALDAAPGPGSEGFQALFVAGTEPWVGVLLPKRWAKRAVTRNAIKRQIYAVSSALEASLPAAAHVVRLRSGFDRKRFKSPSSDLLKQEVRGELQALFAGASRSGA